MQQKNIWLICLLMAAQVTIVARSAADEDLYQTQELSLEGGRTVILTIGTPPESGTVPKGIIVFSHGANAAPLRYRRLLDLWINAGYKIIAPLHVDSEEYPGGPSKDRALILRTRIEDFAQTLAYASGPDITSAAQKEPVLPVPVIAAGHSYGAYIAQLSGGATVVDGDTVATITPQHPIVSVVALSPPPSFPDFAPKGSWSSMSLPLLVQTGTTDIFPPFLSEWQRHLDSHAEAPEDSSFAAVFPNVDHYFGGMICRPIANPEPAMIKALSDFAAISVAFMEWSSTSRTEPFIPSDHARFTELEPVAE